MCGIAGMMLTVAQEAADAAVCIRAMTDAITHRGPDDEGFLLSGEGSEHIYGGGATQPTAASAPLPYYPDKRIELAGGFAVQVALGFRRLSIIDLSACGHQPMSYAQGRYWIVFNGEIYNYQELRVSLTALGHTFLSTSDTEVILAAYAQWGRDCVSRFNGMWAFCIYDTRVGTVFLCRDRMGVKPLYYYSHNGVFLFASEIKALLANPNVAPVLNKPYIERFLERGVNEHQVETPFRHIYRFSPGHKWHGTIAQVPEGLLPTEAYWTVRPNLSADAYHPDTAQRLAAEYRRLLEDAVRIRLRADVPVGTAFSGGLDSSTIVHYIQEQHRRQGVTSSLKTFSTVYQTPGAQSCDESPFIDEMAAQYGLDTHRVEPSAPQVPAMMRRMVWAMETPQESTLMSYMFTYQLVRQQNVTVTLDGQGADELQGGYRYYVVNYFANLPLRCWWAEYRHILQQPDGRGQAKLGMVFGLLRRLGLQAPTRWLLGRLGKFSDPFVPLNERLHRDFVGDLVTLLHYGDHSSMAYSVEARFPFLDYRLVEFWHNVPAAYKIRHGWTKFLAREAMSGLLPDAITWRKDKMGWEIPQDFWFRGELREWFCQTIEQSAFLQSLGLGHDVRQQLDATYRDHRKIKRLIRLLNLALWHELFFTSALRPEVTPEATFNAKPVAS